MARSVFLTNVSVIVLRRSPTSPWRTTLSSCQFPKLKPQPRPFSFNLPLHTFSTTATPYPLQYEMVISRPAQSSLPQPRRRRQRIAQSKPTETPEPEHDAELGFDDWVDRKLMMESAESEKSQPSLNNLEMDKSKRKYYNKRRKRMYGSDSEDESSRRDDDKYVELKPEVVELRTLHKKEEELYFYDTFAYPWEKEKHYKMVYQLEKKYFPDQCFDKAFLEPGESNATASEAKKRVGQSREKKAKVIARGDDKGLVFFDDEGKGKGEREEGLAKDVKMDISVKKVEEFFKCLKKIPNKDAEFANAEPYLSSRSTGLPPRWDSPTGTVVLVNKPKGDPSF